MAGITDKMEGSGRNKMLLNIKIHRAKVSVSTEGGKSQDIGHTG
jgi:hypothetical protein